MERRLSMSPNLCWSTLSVPTMQYEQLNTVTNERPPALSAHHGASASHRRRNNKWNALSAPLSFSAPKLIQTDTISAPTPYLRRKLNRNWIEWLLLFLPAYTATRNKRRQIELTTRPSSPAGPSKYSRHCWAEHLYLYTPAKLIGKKMRSRPFLLIAIEIVSVSLNLVNFIRSLFSSLLGIW